MRIEARAKINWTLDILGRREDGYHLMDMLMQSVALSDTITLENAEETRLQITNCPWLTCGEDNLMMRAARAMQAEAGTERGVAMTLEKRLPSGAGMGGGSADAAAVLRALNTHFGAPLSIGALAEVGGQIGSDIPFCVIGGTCMCEGRGELLRKLPDMPECVFVVCKPEFGVSTPELYRKIDSVAIPKRPDNNAMEGALLAGDLGKVAENVYNVFDPLVTEEHLEMNYIKSIMNTYASLGQQMTGSGSAVFGILKEFEHAAVVCNMLQDNYPNIFIGMPISY